MKKNDRRKRKLQEEACDYEIERTPTFYNLQNFSKVVIRSTIRKKERFYAGLLLLYKAQFQKSFFRCCYLRHILRKAVFFHSLLLRSAQFFRIQGAVVIGSTIPVCRIFSSGVVKRSTFFAERLFHIRIVTESTIQKILFCGCYT